MRHVLTVNVSYVDALNHTETGTTSAGTVAESRRERCNHARCGGGRGPDITRRCGDRCTGKRIVYTWMVDGNVVHTGTDAAATPIRDGGDEAAR